MIGNVSNGAGIFISKSAIYGTLYTSAYPVITGNTIENNNTVIASSTQGGIGSGIVLYFAGSPVVTSNIIRNNGNANSEPAIALLDTNNLVLVQNLIYNNTAGINAAGLEAALSNFNQAPIVGILANNVFANNIATGNVSASQIELDGDLSPGTWSTTSSSLPTLCLLSTVTVQPMVSQQAPLPSSSTKTTFTTQSALHSAIFAPPRPAPTQHLL